MAKKVTKRRRVSYSKEEEDAISAYIANNADAGKTRGNSIWKEMEDKKVTQHTWQSMRDRYLKHMLPNKENEYAIDDSIHQPELKRRKTKLVVNSRVDRHRYPYTPKEDSAILKYIQIFGNKHGNPGSSKGNMIWKDMESEKITSRSWQSMKDRYLKHLQNIEPDCDELTSCNIEVTIPQIRSCIVVLERLSCSLAAKADDSNPFSKTISGDHSFDLHDFLRNKDSLGSNHGGETRLDVSNTMKVFDEVSKDENGCLNEKEEKEEQEERDEREEFLSCSSQLSIKNESKPVREDLELFSSQLSSESAPELTKVEASMESSDSSFSQATNETDQELAEAMALEEETDSSSSQLCHEADLEVTDLLSDNESDTCFSKPSDRTEFGLTEGENAEDICISQLPDGTSLEDAEIKTLKGSLRSSQLSETKAELSEANSAAFASACDAVLQRVTHLAEQPSAYSDVDCFTGTCDCADVVMDCDVDDLSKNHVPEDVQLTKSQKCSIM